MKSNMIEYTNIILQLEYHNVARNLSRTLKSFWRKCALMKDVKHATKLYRLYILRHLLGGSSH